MRPWVGLSCMLEPGFLKSVLPLFQNEEVEMLEWSFDILRKESAAPQWLNGLLTEYSHKGRLTGHGVRYSLLTAKWGKRQDTWLKQAQEQAQKYNYRYITEHFGFMTSGDFHKGAPFPVPLSDAALNIGRDRLMRLQDAVRLPVGLENLAFAFCEDEVKKQGEFLEKLIAPVKGFIILDLHNAWCQSLNFNKDVLSLIKLYPLDKVRELHISGGSWSVPKFSEGAKRVRRDTHDEDVPEELFELLPTVLQLCPNVECVVLERLGHTLITEKEMDQFRKDFLEIKRIVKEAKGDEKYPSEKLKKLNSKNNLSIIPLEDAGLNKQQKKLIDILSQYSNPEKALDKFRKEGELFSEWGTENWNLSMMETANLLLKKWNK